MESDTDSMASPRVEVFWRPGCAYCHDLRGLLLDYEVEATWRNIWSDPDARALVRAANQGNETVPTVRVGGVMLTNPTWRQVAKVLGRDHREPRAPLAPHIFASAGSCIIPKPDPHPAILSAGTLLLAGLVVLLDLLTKTWARGRLADSEHIVSGPVTLLLVHNPGVAFGIGAGSPALATVISVLGLTALLLVLTKAMTPILKAALAIAAAGGIANLLDRLAHGNVTDWIHVVGYSPTFNLADVAVRGGLLVALIAMAWPHRKERRLGKRAHRTACDNPQP